MIPKIVQQFGRSLPKSFLAIAQFTLTCLLVFCLSPVNATTIGYLSEEGELFRQALAASKLTPEDVRLEMKDMDLWGGDKYRVKLLDVFFDNPCKISPYTRTITQDLLAAKSELSSNSPINHC